MHQRRKHLRSATIAALVAGAIASAAASIASGCALLQSTRRPCAARTSASDDGSVASSVKSGRAARRERACQHVELTGVAGSQKNNIRTYNNVARTTQITTVSI